ncbi:MAG: ligase-associated DNA damage response endonuclease PdeM [Flavobacteriaceae bacterium]|nr:ligase-associated DNA damage response endonuclease PdeM [Flavobacteriaceae bacterium]
MKLHWAQEEFILSTGRTIFHRQSNNLILADLHLGKSTHFRKNGIGIPKSIAENDLKILAESIKTFQPSKIIIAGDFFHAEANTEIDLFLDWRLEFKNIKIIVVRGNHDRLKPALYSQCEIDLLEEFSLNDSIKIVHESQSNSEYFQISGHLHPGIIISGKGKQRMRFPAYIFNEKNMILPAFSHFTGLFTNFNMKEFKYVGITSQGLFF